MKFQFVSVGIILSVILFFGCAENRHSNVSSAPRSNSGGNPGLNSNDLGTKDGGGGNLDAAAMMDFSRGVLRVVIERLSRSTPQYTDIEKIYSKSRENIKIEFVRGPLQLNGADVDAINYKSRLLIRFDKASLLKCKTSHEQTRLVLHELAGLSDVPDLSYVLSEFILKVAADSEIAVTKNIFPIGAPIQIDTSTQALAATKSYWLSGTDANNAKCQIVVCTSSGYGIYLIDGVSGEFNQVRPGCSYTSPPEATLFTGVYLGKQKDYEIMTNQSKMAHIMQHGKQGTSINEITIFGDSDINSDQAIQSRSLKFILTDTEYQRTLECTIDSIRMVQ